MIEGKTDTGFMYKVSEENLDNYELLEALGEVEENPLVISKVVNLLLGKKQTEKMKDHVRSKSGIVSAEKMTEELKNIFESVEKAKNS